MILSLNYENERTDVQKRHDGSLGYLRGVYAHYLERLRLHQDDVGRIPIHRSARVVLSQAALHQDKLQVSEGVALGLKVHFSGVNFSSSSGPNSFATRLAQQLSFNGHIIADPSDYDVALVFIEPNSQLDLRKPIIQRLDGIWFNPENFETNNRGIRAVYSSSSAVIFQSDFDHQMCVKWFGEPKQGVVIRNGIQQGRVQTRRDGLLSLRERYSKVFVCSSNWHPQKRLKANVALWKHLRSTLCPTSCLIIMGDHPDVRVADPHVFYAGSQSHDLCLDMYSIADWMIHLAWADHCPNVVIEALSQGCPVICAETGGTKELVGANGLVLNETVPYNFELADYDNPPPIDVTQVLSLPDIVVSAPELDIVRVAQQYESVFQRVLASHNP